MELLGESVGVAGGEAGGGDGIADDDGERAGVEVIGVHGEQLVGPDEGHGDKRNLRLYRYVGRSGDKGLGLTVGRASTLGEDDHREAVPEGLDASIKAGDGVAGAGLVDGDLAGAVEIPADERDLPKVLFRHDAELKG